MAHVTNLQQVEETSASFVNVTADYSTGANSFTLASRPSNGTGNYSQVFEFDRARARELYEALEAFLNSASA